ncbi:hypothetical protein BACUNI_03011 [Bacteroides uniformis ATCC 8492]|uniref:Uncharacterized protein n=1 Tax=Bacteroides uniformis (strain ATCC 8492 / DSM 6597 / CCUG 4942 / CIP 103695 / JCM 5828 / KCTC 5204 / NCTC 13054 / VPI 0061) TaxID=411479 RepID=A0ABC9N890_BACUC|nr:hypothetical protein BACUNI_03011 [Bacteroides uniformis ATCC 8492]
MKRNGSCPKARQSTKIIKEKHCLSEFYAFLCRGMMAH